MKELRIVAAFVSTMVMVFAGPVLASSSGGQASQKAPAGCCDGPGQGEVEIDVLDSGLNEGALVGNEFQATHSVVFAPATIAPAPNSPDTRVWIDQARPGECDIGLERQWAFSGEPHFPPQGDGDEVMQFLDLNDEPMAVNRIRISVGYNNGIGTVTLKAFNCDDELLEEQLNAVEGFQDMEIDRRFTEYPDIHYVVVEAPLDDQGVGINCIRFPPPMPCEPVVPTEPSTWSAIKSLYR